MANVLAPLAQFLRGWLYPRPRRENPDLQRCPKCGNTDEWYVHYCCVCGQALPGYYRRSLAELQTCYERGEMRGVEVLPQEEACLACRALTGKVYAPAEMPRLPYPGCTHPKGCRCSYVIAGTWLR